jgi:hypothetical protein
MATNTPAEVQARLTQIAMAVKPQGMIADLVLPRVKVPGEQFKYTKFVTAENFTIPDTHIGRSSNPNEVEFSSVLEDGSTKDHGLDDFVPKKDLDTAASQNIGYDPQAVATENTSMLVELAREARAADLIFTLTTYASTLRATLSGNDQWNVYTHADSDPIADIEEGIETMLITPNVLVLGRAAWRYLRRHPKLVAAVVNKAGSAAAGIEAAGKLTKQAVADFFELEEVVVGTAFNNTAKKGQTASYSRLWGPHASLLHINRSVTNALAAVPTFGFTAEWQGRRVRVIPDSKRGIDGGNTVRVAEQVNELVTFQELGYHIHNAVAS